MNDLFMSIKGNVVFLLQFLLIIAIIFIVAFLAERYLFKNPESEEKILTTKKVAVIGVFSAIAGVLMLFEIPAVFAPSFYKLDLSELPVLIGAFAYGPVAGVLIEFVKIIVKLIIKGTSTAFVGELANFVVGCSMILPASIIYFYKKSKKSAIIACIVGTVCMAIVGSLFNAVYLLPKFAEMFGMPLEAIVEMGTAVNPEITSVSSLILRAVVPLNLIKGAVVSIVTMLIYKKISHILKSGGQ